MAGTSSTAGDAAIHAFLWTADQGMVDLGTLGGPASVATAVNASGQVVGYGMADPNDIGITHAFSWTAVGGMVDLGTLLHGFSFARNVNNSGQVVGDSFLNGVASRVFSWTPSGGMVDVGNLGSSASPAAVNETGQAVGYSHTANGELHAFSWTADGGMVDLGTLGRHAKHGLRGEQHRSGRRVEHDGRRRGDPRILMDGDWRNGGPPCARR